MQDPGSPPLRDEFPAEDLEKHEHGSDKCYTQVDLYRITYSILSQVHIRREDIRPRTMHLFSQEVLLERTLAVRVVLQRDVPVRAERTRKHRDVAEDGLKRLVEDVGHLVLEVLRCNCGKGVKCWHTVY